MVRVCFFLRRVARVRVFSLVLLAWMSAFWLSLFAFAQATVPNLQYGVYLWGFAGNGKSGYTVTGTTTSGSVRIGSIQDAVFDRYGNLFIADTTDYAILRVDANTHIIASIAGTPQTAGNTCVEGAVATACSIGSPYGIAVDANGNVYFSDQTYHVIRRLDASGAIHLTAGTPGTSGFSGDNGPATAATLNTPNGLLVDAAGAYLYIADTSNSRIRRVNLSSTVITTFAGVAAAGTPGGVNGDGGLATAANLNSPYGIAQSPSGDIYIADTKDYVIRRVDGTLGTISTVAGSGTALTGTAASGNGGLATAAELAFPKRIAFDSAGNLYISDSNYNQIRVVNAVNGTFSATASYIRAYVGSGSTTNPSTYSGQGVAATTAIKAPIGLFFDPEGNLYFCEQGFNTVRKTGPDSEFALTLPYAYSTQAVGSAAASQSVYVAANQAVTLAVSNPIQIAPPTEFSLSSSTCTASDAFTPGSTCLDNIAFTPLLPGLRVATLTTTDSAGAKYVSSLTGVGTAPQLSVLPSTIMTIAGNGTAGYSGDGGAATSATLNGAHGVALDGAGNQFISDTNNNVVRRVDSATGKITTVAGNGGSGYSGDGNLATAATLNKPAEVVVDSMGNLLIADTGNHAVRRVDAVTGVISTYAGTGTSGFAGDGKNAVLAQLASPAGVSVDLLGYVYVSDTGNQRVRVIAPNAIVPGTPGTISTLAGTGVQGYSGDGGPAASAQLNQPGQLTMGPVTGPGNQGAVLYIADTGNNAIRQVTPPWATTSTSASGIIATVAGNGVPGHSGDGGLATNASLLAPNGIAADAAGNLYVADTGNQTVRLVLSTAKTIQTVAGSSSGSSGYTGDGGISSVATLSTPSGLAVDAQGRILIADAANEAIRRIDVTQPSLDFGTIVVNTGSSVTSFTLFNAGNASLSLSTLTVSAGFQQTLNGFTDCTASTTLGAGQGCALQLQFSPGSTTGAITGTANIQDNSLNATAATHTIGLKGTAIASLAPQAITFNAISDQTYGNSALTLNAASSSGLPVGYTVNGPASLSGSTLTLTGKGAISVTASQAGNSTYAAATPVTRTFNVQPATLTVKADNYARSVGAQNPALTYSITGFVNGETQSGVVTGAPVLSTTATVSSPAGQYPITVTQGTLSAANYTFTLFPGTLTVAALTAQTITFAPLASVTYGATPLTLTATASSGLPVIYSVSGPAKVSGSTLTVTGAGSVTVTASQTGNATYAAATPVAQTFTVQPATLSLAISNASKVYGASLPSFTTSAPLGLVNGDSLGTTLSITFTSSATAASPVGSSYTITGTLAGAAATDYTATITPGTLSITPATLTVTPQNFSVVYGSPLPQFTYVLSGFMNGDAATVVSGNPVITSTAPATNPVPAGTYTLSASTGTLTAANYVFTGGSGRLAVTKAATAATLSASPGSAAYAQSVTLTATVTSSAGLPTGTVTFLNGKTSVGSGTLNSAGAATLSTTTLPSGVLSLTASYGGDTNFAPSTSSAVTESIAAPVPDYTLGVTPSAVIFSAGQSGQATVTLTPLFNYAGSVSLSCSGGAIGCSFSPSATLAVSGTSTPVQATVTFSPVATSALRAFPGNATERVLLASLGLLPIGLFRRRRRLFSILPIFILLALLCAVGGCGSDSPAGRGSSVVMMTASGGAGGQTHQFSIEVTVQ